MIAVPDTIIKMMLQNNLTMVRAQIHDQRQTKDLRSWSVCDEELIPIHHLEKVVFRQEMERPSVEKQEFLRPSSATKKCKRRPEPPLDVDGQDSVFLELKLSDLEVFLEEMGDDVLGIFENGGNTVLPKSESMCTNIVNCDESIMVESLASLTFADVEPINEWESEDLEELCGGKETVSCRIESPIPATIMVQDPVFAAYNQGANGSVVDMQSTITDCEVRQGDVLLGRGRKHPGNALFRELVNARFDDYEAARKHQQTIIAKEIVERILSDGGRFLELQGSKNARSWVEIDYKKARLKVAHTFRTIRKKKKKVERMMLKR
jgi:hypothetical protein